MNKSYKLAITLWVRAPLMTSGGGNSQRGIDRMFNRDSSRKLVLQSSHIKGKLREALEELQKTGVVSSISPDNLFGRWAGEGAYTPNRASLIFDDFYLDKPHTHESIGADTRVAINPLTGTGLEHQLYVIEKLFPAGAITRWKGAVRFWETDDNSAKRIADNLTLGFKWMTTIGGIKGSGYGRLEKVISKLEVCGNKIDPIKAEQYGREFSLIIELEDDLFIGGGVKSTNYMESQRIIPGSVIKGSLAKFINQSCGAEFRTPINYSNNKVSAAYPNLAKYFYAIRFSHAFPAPPQMERRPVSVPLSTVRDPDDNYYDVALLERSDLDKNGEPPEFQIDWKAPKALDGLFGWGGTQTINKTRTKIYKKTRSAEENNLYTFCSISPYAIEKQKEGNDKGHPAKIQWIGNITLPEIGNNNPALVDEFHRALNSGWEYMGKRNSRFTFHLKNGYAQKAIPELPMEERLAIITLQTEALLIDAYQCATLHEIKDLYKGYWRYATKDSCEQVRFFARQSFYGGYMSMIYPFHAQGKYYPYLMTTAGSVFVLRAKAGQEEIAKKVLDCLKEQGLPLPRSVLDKLKNISEEDHWRHCPFVPQNGFGEISLNLEWHWRKNSNSINPDSKGERL